MKHAIFHMERPIFFIAGVVLVLMVSGVAHSQGSWQVTPGATISGLTGSGSSISGADTNPNDYGAYSAAGSSGTNIIGGPLLTDSQAASFVKATPQSSIEANSQGNLNDNNYFNYVAANNPNGYLNELSGFYAAYQGSGWQQEVDRIDGACPIANPTTAEAIQWAGNKWGINPILMYGVVTVESGWDQTGIGDNGGSSGIFQVADRNTSQQPNHAYPGFDGSGANLARENTCFNADFWAGRLFSTFHGLTGQSPAGNVDAAIESWYAGTAQSGGSYTNSVYYYMDNGPITWERWYFGGQNVPY